MLIKLVGNGTELVKLEEAVRSALQELSLSEFVHIETTDDTAYKTELGISVNPALCIEEDSIEFKDMIFEGIVPEHIELVSMFASIFGTSDDGCGTGGCSSGGSCGTGGCGGCSGH